MPSLRDIDQAAAWRFIILAGVVSLFSDMTYEGARSISGPFLGTLKASAPVVGVVAGLVLGRLFDRLGMPVIVVTAVLSAFFAPLVFLGGFKLALLGMVLWGIGVGSLESIIKAALAGMVPRDRRATGFGLFNAGFGVFWLLGSALMGFLYDFSLGALVAFSITAQLLAIPFFLAVSKKVCFQPR